MLIINFKTYEQGTGLRALKLAKICKEVSQKTKIKICVAVQASDIFQISKTKIDVYAQHIDPLRQGAFTGSITAEAVKEAGACGSLLNHSEHPLSFNKIKYCVEKLKSLKMKSIVCTPTVWAGVKIAGYMPDFVAVEPPELIGKISVAKARPEIITEAVKQIPGKVLVGAGIKSKKDTQKIAEYKAFGALISSNVVKADNPRKVLTELALGMKNG